MSAMKCVCIGLAAIVAVTSQGPNSSASASNSSAPALPNIDYLGSGYDIFKGNPHSTGQIDPGFMGKVLELKYDNGAKTGDQRYVIPDRTTAVSASMCDSGFETTKIHGAQSFFHSLSVETQVDFAGFGASFSASVDYHDVSSQTSSQEKMYSEAKASCSVYKVRAQSYDPPKATEDFTYGVESLPESFDSTSAQQFYDFISVFGTHVMTGVEMGGRFGHRLEFTRDAWTTLHESGVDVDVAARYAGTVSAGASCETQEQQRMAENYSRASTSERIYNLGGQYSKTAAQWAESVKDDPMPIIYTLKRLDEILTSSFMPALNASVLSSRQEGLKAAIDKYCEKLHGDGLLPNCDGPPADQPMEMRTNLAWSNSNAFTHDLGMDQCSPSHYVTHIRWKSYGNLLAGYEVLVTCSDGASWWHGPADHSTDDIPWDTDLKCDAGFSQVAGRNSDGYIVNFQTYCMHDFIEQDSNKNYHGAWDPELICPEWAPVVVGFEHRWNDAGHGGFVNFRVRCSNGGHAVVGGHIGHVEVVV